MRYHSILQIQRQILSVYVSRKLAVSEESIAHISSHVLIRHD